MIQCGDRTAGSNRTAAYEADPLAGAAGNIDNAVFDGPLINDRSAGGIVLSVQQCMDDGIVTQMICADADPAATGIFELPVIVIVI